MDRASSQRGSRAESDMKSTPVNFPKALQAYRSEDVHSSHLSSRLGYSRTILSTGPPEVPPESDAVQRSPSLFQNAGVSDMQLYSVKSQPPTKSSAVNSPPPVYQMENITNEALISSCSQNPTNPDCGSGPSAFASSQEVSRKSLKNSSPSVSRLCFPFVTTPSPRRNKSLSPPHPPRHKYSCFPSLMSPVSPGRPYPRHQRHVYRQHGYSRMALLQVKWFWSLREEEWQDRDSQTCSTAACGGKLSNGKVTFPLPLHRSTPGPGTSVSSNPPSPITVHPRFGDLKALRDPYCIQLDQYFISLSPWTIRKILWMFEVLRPKHARFIQSPMLLEEDPSDVESENELDMSSASTNFGDDSDTTLVESENEADSAYDTISSVKATSQAKAESEIRFAVSSSVDLFALNAILENGAWLHCISSVAAKPRPVHDNQSRWTTNWYQRWAIVLELSQFNKDRRRVLRSLTDADLDPWMSTKRNTFRRHNLVSAKVVDSDNEDP